MLLGSWLPWHCTLLVEERTVGLPHLDGQSGGVVGAHPGCITQGFRISRWDYYYSPLQLLPLKKVVQHTGGPHTHLSYLRTGANHAPVHAPPRCQDSEGTFHYQTSPAEAVVEHSLLQSVMLSREWPQQVGHEWERLIPHKHVRKWPPLLCAGDDTGGREVKGAIAKSFPKRGVTEGAAVTRPAVASNIHNPEQVVGVHYGEEDQGPVPRSSLRGLAGYVELQAWVSCTTKVDLF